MSDQSKAKGVIAKTWKQALLGFLARGWNGAPADDAAAPTPPAWAPRPDTLFRSTRAAFGSQR